MLLPRLQVSCVFLLLGHNFLGDLFGRLSAGGRSILAELPNKKCIHAFRVNGSHQALKKVQYTGRILSLSLSACEEGSSTQGDEVETTHEAPRL